VTPPFDPHRSGKLVDVEVGIIGLEQDKLLEAFLILRY